MTSLTISSHQLLPALHRITHPQFDSTRGTMPITELTRAKQERETPTPATNRVHNSMDTFVWKPRSRTGVRSVRTFCATETRPMSHP